MDSTGPQHNNPIALCVHYFFYVRFHVLLFITKMIQFNYILLIHLDAMDNFGDEQ